jgi:hypothetical protein
VCINNWSKGIRRITAIASLQLIEMDVDVDDSFVQSYLQQKLDILQTHVGNISLKFEVDKSTTTKPTKDTSLNGKSTSYEYIFTIDGNKNWIFQGQKNTIGTLEITGVNIEIP